MPDESSQMTGTVTLAPAPLRGPYARRSITGKQCTMGTRLPPPPSCRTFYVATTESETTPVAAEQGRLGLAPRSVLYNGKQIKPWSKTMQCVTRTQDREMRSCDTKGRWPHALISCGAHEAGPFDETKQSSAV
jgi:hypothetical protein